MLHALGTRHAVAGLKEAQGKAWSASGTLGDERWQRLFQVPLQRLGTVLDDLGQLFGGVEIEPQYQPHPVSEWLKEAVFVGAAEEQGEFRERQALE